ncbi:MAG: FGGY-family carbohydrate kinase [Spirochaetia bacterium]
MRPVVQGAVASLVLTFDIGTSSIKAGLFERDTARAVWQHREPLPSEEHELAAWETERWVRAVQAFVDQMPPSPEIAAVVLSGNGPTIVPVGRDGSSLDQAMLWMDRREERVLGQRSFFLPKISWIKHNAPAVYDQTWQFMTCPEYIGFLLTSVPHTTTASEEFAPYIWDDDGLLAYGVEAEKLPPLLKPGEMIGSIDRRGAELFRLPLGIPVFAGGPDFLMSLLGTAVVKLGRTCDRAGMSEGINHCSSEPCDSSTVRCLPHVVPGLYNVAGILSSTGRIFEWFRRISRQRSVGYERMLREIAATGFDHEPYFFPSVHEGAAWEFSKGMFVGLRWDHATAEMGRGVVYSIGYAVRQSIESLKAVGCNVEELRVCGGQAKSPIWNQMKADITGIPVVRPEVIDAELLGSACCAFVGLGDFSTPWEASVRVVRMTERFEPDPARSRRFTDGYERYLRAYQRYSKAIREAEEADF